MVREFEGKTEQEAIEKAVETLHIEQEDFDVEVIDNGRKGLFKKGDVKIRIHLLGEEQEEDSTLVFDQKEEPVIDSEEEEEDLPVNEELESAVCSFVDNVIAKMGYSSTTEVTSRKGKKVNFEISSEDSSIIIGRKGKNLDALQVLVNVFAGKIDNERKIVIDAEGYRVRHEEQIIRMAFKTAQIVKKTGRSRLLEPMNPYERRLVHTALNDVADIDTKSEGEGLYKQVRIISTKKY